jgi:alcohol/geraniol dehydrogenase (NADP+)
MNAASRIRAYAAAGPGGPLEPFEYDPGALGAEQVEIEVEHCGICHSDLSMLDNEWRNTAYPFVPGHEVVGRVAAAGGQVKGLRVGDRVGLGWIAGSCQHCRQCLGGDPHLCREKEETIVNRHGGFAERVRCHWSWAIRLPEGLEAAAAGPLFCGGITVFQPIVDFGVQPLDRVGVVGIGGLGHMALMFLRAWGCEVTAFTSSEAKYAEAKKLGAHHAVSSTDKAGLKKLARSLDFILVTSNVTLEWGAYLGALAPRGRLHVVGAVLEPIPVSTFGLMGGQRSLSSSPTGSPLRTLQMLEFCARHRIAPMVEHFPLAHANAALARLREGKARYRIVLDR